MLQTRLHFIVSKQRTVTVVRVAVVVVGHRWTQWLRHAGVQLKLGLIQGTMQVGTTHVVWLAMDLDVHGVLDGVQGVVVVLLGLLLGFVFAVKGHASVV